MSNPYDMNNIPKRIEESLKSARKVADSIPDDKRKYYGLSRYKSAPDDGPITKDWLSTLNVAPLVKNMDRGLGYEDVTWTLNVNWEDGPELEIRDDSYQHIRLPLNPYMSQYQLLQLITLLGWEVT